MANDTRPTRIQPTGDRLPPPLLPPWPPESPRFVVVDFVVVDDEGVVVVGFAVVSVDFIGVSVDGGDGVENGVGVNVDGACCVVGPVGPAHINEGN